VLALSFGVSCANRTAAAARGTRHEQAGSCTSISCTSIIFTSSSRFPFEEIFTGSNCTSSNRLRRLLCPSISRTVLGRFLTRARLKIDFCHYYYQSKLHKLAHLHDIRASFTSWLICTNSSSGKFKSCACNSCTSDQVAARLTALRAAAVFPFKAVLPQSFGVSYTSRLSCTNRTAAAACLPAARGTSH
jgi:hypothetical protein